MANWPADTQNDLSNFYGKHVLKPDGHPTTAWEREHLVTITLPYPMLIAWDLSKEIKKLTCHRLAAESLERVLIAILDHYGSVASVRQSRMHLFGGCYNYRPVVGTSRLSTHAWGASIDIDPEHNPLAKPYDEALGMMPSAVLALFDAEGWKWGGRFVNRPDCMHFQATK
jgi:hypothetical protein